MVSPAWGLLRRLHVSSRLVEGRAAGRGLGCPRTQAVAPQCPQRGWSEDRVPSHRISLLNHSWRCEGRATAPQTIVQNLFSKACYFFFPLQRLKFVLQDKSNAFGKITLRFSFLTNGSGSENQVTIVQGSVNCGNKRKAGEDRTFKEKAQEKKKNKTQTGR